MGVDVATLEPEHRLRADAQRNRDRIIAAARDAFLETGPDVALDAIAHRAGVGNATVYRHFADRDELVLAVALSAIDRIIAHADLAIAAEPDAFEALRRFAFKAADERIGSLSAVFCGVVEPSDPRVVDARVRFEAAVDRVMDRARRAGQLRPDVERGDLLAAITQLTRPVPGTTCGQFGPYVHRHLNIFLDGLRAPARSTLPGAAVTLEGLRQRMS
ncbi:MAG TPA: TetR/AcrR family transcriptional regulator [Jiangellaceae bacterium]|nr:TetR/AcrR family transcriptional regulator [Jiangellaceae bacterium]